MDLHSNVIMWSHDGTETHHCHVTEDEYKPSHPRGKVLGVLGPGQDLGVLQQVNPVVQANEGLAAERTRDRSRVLLEQRLNHEKVSAESLWGAAGGIEQRFS